MLWRAFDKTVRRKPLAFAADAVYGNSIDLELEIIAKKGVARKAWSLLNSENSRRIPELISDEEVASLPFESWLSSFKRSAIPRRMPCERRARATRWMRASWPTGYAPGCCDRSTGENGPWEATGELGRSYQYQRRFVASDGRLKSRYRSGASPVPAPRFIRRALARNG